MAVATDISPPGQSTLNIAHDASPGLTESFLSFALWVMSSVVSA